MRFRAIEHVLPSRAVDNVEMLQRIHDDSKSHLSDSDLRRLLRMMKFAFHRMGTDMRYGRAEGERASDLAAQAGRKALRAAGLEPGEIDLLVYVGVGRGFLEPATANVFQDLLSLENATCFDVLDACASWVRALHIARAYLETDTYRNVMILNAEFNGDLENYEFRSVEEFEHRFPSFTIGEATTATIVSRSEADDPDDEWNALFRSYGDQREKCIIPLPNYAEFLAGSGEPLEPMRFTSWGHDLMDFGLERLVEQYHEEPAFHTFDPDIVFFHAAADGMAREGMRRCGVDEEKVFYSHGRFANTVSATVPLAMSVAADEGRLREGMKVILAIASAGISTALCRFRYLR